MAAVRRSAVFLKKYVSGVSSRYMSIISHKLVYSDYGEPSQVVKLETEELDPPGPGKVLVKMLAAPVNPADINTIQGVYPVKPPLPSTPGNEGVGRVEEIGEDVKTLKVGDWVLPRQNAWGTWRSYAVCDESELMQVAAGLDVVAAATLAVNPCTAYRMLKDFVQLEARDTVIQNGGNSSCGQCVIQLCKAWDINCVSIVRDRDNIEGLKKHLMDLGAAAVLTEEEINKTAIFKRDFEKPKLALNCVGGKNALDMLRHLDANGTMVTYGGMSRLPVTIPTSALIFKDITLKGFWMTRWNKNNAGSADHAVMLTALSNLYKIGRLKPPAHELLPLSSFRDVLDKAMNISGKTGKKFIFDFNK